MLNTAVASEDFTPSDENIKKLINEPDKQSSICEEATTTDTGKDECIAVCFCKKLVCYVTCWRKSSD